MNRSLTRIDRLAFWNMIDEYASPLKLASYSPLSISVRAFFSSLALQLMNSRTSGCQSLMDCIFAARRVLPPDFTTAAIWSYTRMNDSGPDGVPPPESFSRLERIVETSVPVPEPNLNSMASEAASRMIDSMLSSTDWMKHADACGNSYGDSGRWTFFVCGS